MSKGYVYVLTNAFMPGLVKIGKTTRTVEGRASELYQTGVPTPFDVFFSGLAPDCHEVESWVHGALADKRVNDSREFFAVEPEVAKRQVEDAINEQLSAWVEEFAPDQILVDWFAYVDPSVFYILSERLGVAPPDVASAMNEITAEELRPALERHVARWKKAPELRVVAE